jgi:DNA-directed RNA polymerase specialized sigma24 family protein
VAPRAAQTVQLRFFAGLSLTETAALLDVTTRTVERDWQFARAWLYRELNENQRRAG